MTIRVRNSATVDFSATGDWTTTAPQYYVGLWVDDAGGTDRYLGATGLMTGVTENIENLDTLRFAANTIVHNFTAAASDRIGEAGLKALFDAGVAASNVTFKYSLHDANPGSTGAGELDSTNEPGYARVEAAVTVDTN